METEEDNEIEFLEFSPEDEELNRLMRETFMKLVASQSKTDPEIIKGMADIDRSKNYTLF